ncbi:MAG: hypothetical protein N3E49_02970 [Bacteroidia bacterium]|nr:hypothetical protein [Bacteroidia bacterium]
MKAIIVTVGFLAGGLMGAPMNEKDYTAKEATVEVFIGSEVSIGPRKNYRYRMARAYFGKRAGCRRGSYCGR